MSRVGGKLQPPEVVDVGCGCRTPRLLSSLVSSLKSRLGGGGKPPIASSPQHVSSSAWSSSTATAAAFTPSATSCATTTASSTLSLDHASSWGVATFGATNDNALYLYEEAVADDAREEIERRQQRRRQRRRQQRRRTRRRGRCGNRMMEQVGEEETTAAAVAVEVDSAAPYQDFRDSMVAMVTEKEMYAWEDLNALLHRFLALNSPRHHPLILGAFADLWAPRGGIFCPPSRCLH